MQLPRVDEVDERSVLGLCMLRSKGVDGTTAAELLKDPNLLKTLDNTEFRERTARALKLFWEQLSSNSFLVRCAEDLQRWSKGGIRTIALGSAYYPSDLANIFAPPPLLFYRGCGDHATLGAQLKGSVCFSIVGSRKADVQGCEIALAMAQALAQKGVCIVSGLALGVDGAAHRGALRSTSTFPTIAVLGNGLETVYPTMHERLAGEIIERGGILLSQFEPGERPYPSNFLNRNRIIAGLSGGVLVVQASQRSGSLVTARYAMEEGREVLVVPGSITHSQYEGSNRLIRQGAVLARSVEDILEELPQLNISKTEEKVATRATEKLPPAQAEIIAVLRKQDSVHYDELCRRVKGQGKKEGLFAENILELELLGRVVRVPGNLIALKPAV
ncbi:DNA-processing protein DprA [Oligoflexia bacterium]|nr:DNA-processing protein DprA [Oligoflexia bacterium]